MKVKEPEWEEVEEEKEEWTRIKKVEKNA
jgi:hypothetical protein